MKHPRRPFRFYAQSNLKIIRRFTSATLDASTPKATSVNARAEEKIMEREVERAQQRLAALFGHDWLMGDSEYKG